MGHKGSKEIDIINKVYYKCPIIKKKKKKKNNTIQEIINKKK